ncbi:MAG: T9SS type A sorting domain-containing protein [Chitinophagales bacterium]|nr:T9SS type A sorting domain-containing protein [Chitinophagales bacterium]
MNTQFAIITLVTRTQNTFEEGFPDTSEIGVYKTTVKENLWDRVRRVDYNIISLHPNPASNTLHVSGYFTEKTRILLSDIAGKIIWQESNAAGAYNHSIDVSNLQSGPYLFHIKSGIKLLAGKKLIIK